MHTEKLLGELNSISCEISVFRCERAGNMLRERNREFLEQCKKLSNTDSCCCYRNPFFFRAVNRSSPLAGAISRLPSLVRIECARLRSLQLSSCPLSSRDVAPSPAAAAPAPDGTNHGLPPPSLPVPPPPPSTSPPGVNCARGVKLPCPHDARCTNGSNPRSQSAAASPAPLSAVEGLVRSPCRPGGEEGPRVESLLLVVMGAAAIISKPPPPWYFPFVDASLIGFASRNGDGYAGGGGGGGSDSELFTIRKNASTERGKPTT